MSACSNRACTWMVFLSVVVSLVGSAQAADKKYDATITYCGGQKSMVKDFRIVYSWREMPATSEGLTPYKLQSRGEQGVWVVTKDKTTPVYALVPFSELDSIEIESVVQSLNDSSIFQFRIQRVRLHRLDGKIVELTGEVLGESTPVLWPRHTKVKFPEGLGDMRMDRIMVSLQGKTKMSGEDSDYMFVLPTSLSEANRTILTKARDSFPQRIQIVPARGDGSWTAQTAR